MNLTSDIMKSIFEAALKQRISEMKKLIIAKKISREDALKLMNKVLEDMNISNEMKKIIFDKFNKDLDEIHNESHKNNENFEIENKIIELEKRICVMEEKLTFMSKLLKSFIDNKLNEDSEK